MQRVMIERRSMLVAVAATLGLLVVGCTSMPMMMTSQSIALSGSNEVPALNTGAAGTGSVNVQADRSVTATVTVTGMTPTAAHIHEAAKGVNGPVIVPFVKQGDNTFVAPPGSKLTEAQYASYKAGNLYVNVHSAAHPGGEVRAQLTGK